MTGQSPDPITRSNRHRQPSGQPSNQDLRTEAETASDASEAMEDHLAYHLTSQDAAEDARKYGKLVEFPDHHTLQIDIDGAAAMKHFEDTLPWLRRLVAEIYPAELIEADIRPSRHQDHYHIRVRLPFCISPMERIALQAVLGSDYKRELLSIFDYWGGDETPTVFFEDPPASAPKIPPCDIPF